MMQSQTVEVKEHSDAELDQIYRESESVDKPIFAEMRSNILLISGDHYQKRYSEFFTRIRDSKDITEQQKLRLTKNHVQRIIKAYSNQILSSSPDVSFSPKNENEMQDTKKAELHQSIWVDGKERYNLDSKKEDFCDDFLGIGEVFCKIFYDPYQGKLKGYEQAVDELGMPCINQDGSPQIDQNKPVYTGMFTFERIFGFNILRAPDVTDFDDSPYLVSRKMSQLSKLKRQFPDVAEKLNSTANETFIVFDSMKGGYSKSENEAMVLEYFFKPCEQYPNGYYYFRTGTTTLAKGELPGGIFPIISELYEKFQTSPRGRAPVKTMRPYQVEINRSASKIAEHQITLGDDKLLLQKGTEVSQGVSLPGVRTVNYTGIDPKILAGRDGSQYLNYMLAQIEELYRVMNMEELNQRKEAGDQADAYALLFRSAKQKQVFQRNVRRFQRFWRKVAETYVRLCKIHLPEDEVIRIVGKNEIVNISEFKSLDDLSYEVKIDDQSEDIETKLGKQLVFNHLIQFAGAQLEKEDLGEIIRAMPYANSEKAIKSLTIRTDSALNEMLALDRGETPVINDHDDHGYMVNRLTARMREPDFKFLDPQIQQNYKDVITIREELLAHQMQQEQALKDGFIPTGGYMVVCDLYMPDPKDPSKTKRARLPYESMNWLIKRLEAQGMSLEAIDRMQPGVAGEVYSQMGGSSAMDQAAPPQPGQVSP